MPSLLPFALAAKSELAADRSSLPLTPPPAPLVLGGGAVAMAVILAADPDPPPLLFECRFPESEKKFRGPHKMLCFIALTRSCVHEETWDHHTTLGKSFSWDSVERGLMGDKNQMDLFCCVSR